VAKLITDIQKIKFDKITEFEKNRSEFISFADYVQGSTLKHHQVCLESNKISKQFVDDSLKFIIKSHFGRVISRVDRLQ